MSAGINKAVAGQQSALATLVASDGSASHPMLWRLAERTASQRDLADAVHAFCTLHGRLPGVIEYASMRNALPLAEHWLATAERGIAEERAFLARLTSAAGPLPSTPGQAETEATIAAQRHALDMLAQSDRNGCALGAAVGLVLDWQALRTVLNAAALRFGIEGVPAELPGVKATSQMVAAAAQTPAVERAIGFGAQQLLAQHRGLWDLLEARASARTDS